MFIRHNFSLHNPFLPHLEFFLALKPIKEVRTISLLIRPFFNPEIIRLQRPIHVLVQPVVLQPRNYAHYLFYDRYLFGYGTNVPRKGFLFRLSGLLTSRPIGFWHRFPPQIPMEKKQRFKESSFFFQHSRYIELKK